MNLTYADIAEYVQNGLDDQAILDALHADRRTYRPVALDSLLYTMNLRGMLSRADHNDEQGSKWRGTIRNVSIAVQTSGDTEAADNFLKWFSHITNDRNSVFNLNDASFAASFAAIKSTFADGPTFPTTEDFEAIEELGGGLKYASVELSEVIATRADEARRVHESAVQDLIDTARARIDSLGNKANDNDADAMAELTAIAGV